jgi:hypothetical protein
MNDNPWYIEFISLKTCIQKILHLYSYKVSNLMGVFLVGAPSTFKIICKKNFACQDFAGWLPHFFKSVMSYFSCQLFFLAALPSLKDDASCLYCSLLIFERHQMI